MKSAAQRQREMRLRRRAQGDLRQLNLWVPIETHEKLTEISRATKKSLSEALHDVLNVHGSKNIPSRKRHQSNKQATSPQLELKLFE